MTFIASLLIAGVAACIGLGPIESRAPGQVERVSAPTITAQTATAQRSSIVPAAQSINPNLQGWPVIRQGRDNAPVTVRSLQYLLNAHGSALAVDGAFGPKTDAAVRTYQSRNGLVVDGIVGTRTWSSLAVTVRRGNAGSAVKAVQDQLNARSVTAGGAPFLVVDGIFGPKTEAAVLHFQNRLADYIGFDVDGIVGPETWQALITQALPRG